MTIEIEDRGSSNEIRVHESVKRTGNMKVVLAGDCNKLDIGAQTVIGSGLIELRNSGCEIVIGSNCLINGWLRCRADESRISIGDKTTIMWAQITLHERGRVALGQDCMLSGDIRMDVSDMHSILEQDTGVRINPPGDIVIGDHVWIGQGVHILKGNSVGNDSILGAKSLISSPVPSNCIVAGVPARVIRTGITWDRKLLPLT